MANRQAGARPLRVVSVNVRGRPARGRPNTGDRCELLSVTVETLVRSRWGAIDAVLLLPAGYFKLRLALGPLDSSARADAVDRSEIGRPCRRAAERLALNCGGTLLITGVDTRGYVRGFSGDQMMVAWDTDGVVGSARKLFPSDGDTNEEERAALLLYPQDADDGARLVRLPGGAGLLCVCYDAFVFSELALGPTGKRGAMRYLFDAAQGWRNTEPMDRDHLLDKFATVIGQATPDLVLVGVHGFIRPGREIYWQRHGIATVCAALGGVLTVGAAHFRECLPDAEDPTSGVLASIGVKHSHLTKGLHRKARRLPAAKSAEVSVPGRPKLSAVLRLFEG